MARVVGKIVYCVLGVAGGSSVGLLTEVGGICTANGVQLSAGVPVVVLLASLMHWSDVLSSLPSAISNRRCCHLKILLGCPTGRPEDLKLYP